MDWKRLLNPWGQIRRLEDEICRMDGVVETLRDELREARRDGYEIGYREFSHRTRALQAQNEQLLQAHVGLSNLQPPKTSMVSDPFYAAASVIANRLF